VLRTRSRAIWWLGLASLCIVGVVLVLAITRHGPGASGDSVHYIMGAQNLLAGNGYARTTGGGEPRPISGFPPFYSTVLAAMGLLGFDIFAGAALLNALLFGANLALTALLIQRYTRSKWAALAGALLVLTHKTQVFLHAWVMTEPLYTFLTLLAITALVEYLDRRRAVLLVASAVLVSLATLTRYAGLALMAAAFLGLWLLSRDSWKRRLLDSALFATFTLAPLYLWFRRNALVAGTLVNRDFIFHPMRADLARAYLREILTWFAPRELGLPRPLRVALMALLAIPAPTLFFYRRARAFLSSRAQQNPYWTLPWILLFYLAAYAGILIMNSLLLDAATTLGAPSRYLAPIYVMAVVLVVLATQEFLQDRRLRKAKQAVALVMVALLAAVGVSQWKPWVHFPQGMTGYTGLRSIWTDTVAGLRALDPEAPLISNNPELIYMLAGRPAFMLPTPVDVYSLTQREDYEQWLAAIRSKLEKGAVIILFGDLRESEQQVLDALGAERLVFYYDSVLYGYPDRVDPLPPSLPPRLGGGE